MDIPDSTLHLQNHELLRRAERRTRLLQAANQVGRQIASVRNPDSLLSGAVETICEVYGFCCARIFLIDESGRWARLRAERGQATPAEDQKLRIEGDTAVSVAISTREAHILPGGGQNSADAREGVPSAMGSEVALPLIVGDQVLGAVTLHSLEENTFEGDDLTPLQTMANYVAMAIHNARLFQQLEATHAELLRTKTFEAIATTTGEALHWVGNKAAPIPGSASSLANPWTACVSPEPTSNDRCSDCTSAVSHGSIRGRSFFCEHSSSSGTRRSFRVSVRAVSHSPDF